MRFFDWLFWQFLKLLAKFVRLFIPKPKFGSVDINRTDSLKEKR